ncbi:MAG: response regulator transcription factor [Acidobacteriota bacterium]
MSNRRAEIRVLVVEDHTFVRQGLVSMIEQQPDMTVVGEVSNGRDAVDGFRKLKPTVTLMDLRLPEMDGFEAMQLIRTLDPQARIVVLTACQGDEDIYRALDAGALGYLMKASCREEVLQTIRMAHAGKRRIAASVAACLAEMMPRMDLTPREVEVLRLVARGESNKEIGVALSINETTVKVHVRSILGKLGARDRTEAVMIALRRGIICVGRTYY